MHLVEETLKWQLLWALVVSGQRKSKRASQTVDGRHIVFLVNLCIARDSFQFLELFPVSLRPRQIDHELGVIDLLFLLDDDLATRWLLLDVGWETSNSPYDNLGVLLNGGR
jgi:hypothetical protein